MKKIFSFLTAILFAGSMMAESVDFSAQGYENAQAIESYVGTNFSVAFAQGTNSNNAPKYYTTGTAIRCYGGNTMTVSSAKDITKIVITFGGSDGTNTISVAPGALSEDTWTGSAKEVVFTIDGTSGQRRIKALEVTVDGGDEPAPAINPWSEIIFDKAIPADSLEEVFSFETNDGFRLVGTDDQNKISVDGNTASFGTAEEYNQYDFRLKTGGKSQTGSKNNFIMLAIPADGFLRIAVRTGSNSDSTRTLVVTEYQPDPDTIYNQVVKESDAITVPVTDSTSTKVYPYIIVPVRKGALSIGYPVNGLNFYSLAFMGKVVTPIIEGEEVFTDSVVITMSCATPNADIYYTIDGTTDPKCDCSAAPEYKSPIVIKETTTIKAAAYTGNDWSAVITKTFTKKEGPKNLGPKTIAEFLELKNTKDTCILTGVVDSLVNTVYGNFNLVDATGKVYVYGLLTPAGEAKKFADLGVAEGDTLTVLALYNEYNNNPQVKNAIFVSNAKYQESAEPVVFGVKVPEQGRPEAVNLIGTFADKPLALSLNPETGWFLGYNFPAKSTDLFALCDAADPTKVLCAKDGEYWRMIIVAFGDVWKDDTWKGDSVKWVELDLSDTVKYAWMEAPTPIAKTYFASGEAWAADTVSYAEWDPFEQKIIVHIAETKVAQWQAQVFSKTAFVAREGYEYQIKFKMKANREVGGITFKYQDDAEVFYRNDIKLEADKEFVLDTAHLAGVAGGNGLAVFDFGYAQAGTVIEIYDFEMIEVENRPTPTYEVAEAIAAAPADGTKMYVRGVITKMEIKGTSFKKYGSVNIYVADATGAEGEFEFYNCYSLNADTFKTTTPQYDASSSQWMQLENVVDANGVQVCVGDTVIALGEYLYYTDKNVHELNTGCFLTDIKHAEAVVSDTIVLDFSEGSGWVSNEYFEDYGSTDLVLYNIPVVGGALAGDGDYLVFDFYPEDANDVSGTYTIADETLDDYYTYLLRINGADTTEVEFTAGELKLEVLQTAVEQSIAQIKLEALLVGSDNNIYVVADTFVLYYEFIPTEGIEDVIDNKNAAIKRIEKGQFIIEKNGVLYNATGARIR